MTRISGPPHCSNTVRLVAEEEHIKNRYTSEIKSLIVVRLLEYPHQYPQPLDFGLGRYTFAINRLIASSGLGLLVFEQQQTGR